MQVSHSNDHVTHAVIGGAKTIDFGISNSAEFFNILSSTLYKDQILAVVREVLCNGWDAHIEAGIQHKPVEITLTDTKFTIKDYGTGIHLDDMGVIYGTYGNSTKKNDGKQTGGFGLGCKAPFAYTDHFEVISCNDGIKTIYNLSKSSAQAQGKPGIVPIASFPTPDTGLQVSINIKNANDARRFRQLIQRIARNGDMNMTLNSKPIEKLNFDAGKSNFFIIRGDDLLDIKHSIMVRYGNVIYPVESVPEIAVDFSTIVTHLEKLKQKNHYESYRIIFQAPPHSISVQPNREGLSMQEHTIKTLIHLLSGFTKTLTTEFPIACEAVAEKVINTSVSDGVIAELLQRESRLPVVKRTNALDEIDNVISMADRYMEHNYPNRLGFRVKDITMRLQKMLAAGMLNRGVVQTFMRELNELNANPDASIYRIVSSSTWLQRRIIGPLLSKILKQDNMDTKRLYVYDPEDANFTSNMYRQDRPPLVEATSARPRNLFDALPYLRNIVVLATSRTDIKDRAFRHDIFKKMGKTPGFLFYHVSMKKGARDAAVAFFQANGMNIVDLTVRQSWEPALIHGPRTALPRKPVKKGLACLSGILQATKNVDTRLSRMDDVARIDKPEFIVLLPINDDTSKISLPRWSEVSSRYIIELYGARGGITTTTPMHDKWMQNGAQNFTEFIEDTLCNEMLTNPRIQEFWTCNLERAQAHNWDRSMSSLVQAVLRSDVLRTQFNLVCDLTPDDRKIIHLWEEMLRKYYHNIPQRVSDVSIALMNIPWNPNLMVLRKKLDKNPMLDILDQTGLLKILNKNVSTSREHKAAIDILVSVINH